MEKNSTLFLVLILVMAALVLGLLIFRVAIRGRSSRRKSTNVISIIMIVITINCYRVCFFHHKYNSYYSMGVVAMMNKERKKYSNTAKYLLCAKNKKQIPTTTGCGG